MNIKISITFAAMKGLRKILIRSFFLLAVSLFLGINSYSYYNASHINNEILTGTSNIENSISANTDTMNEDQINQSEDSDLSHDQLSLISPRQAYFPIPIFCFSIWQPPKIS
jgi:hypothetical protein